MHIFDINMYRDGGSIEFHIECDGHTRKVWLASPFRGDLRALSIDSVTVGRGDPAVRHLLEDIEEWWDTLSPEVQQLVREVMAHKGPYYNPDAETMQALDFGEVLFVQDYVIHNYVA